MVSYIPPKDIVYSSFEKMYEEELKILDIHIVYVPTIMYKKDGSLKSDRGKKSGES